jgi:hypothetical protein
MCKKNLNFKSLEEEMDFWNTHDTTDFIEEEVTIEDIIRENTQQYVMIKLDLKLLDDIKTLAGKLGVDCPSLIRDLLSKGLKSYYRS